MCEIESENVWYQQNEVIWKLLGVWESLDFWWFDCRYVWRWEKIACCSSLPPISAESSKKKLRPTSQNYSKRLRFSVKLIFLPLYVQKIR